MAKTITKVAFIILISLPLAGCSVFNNDDYIDDKPWNQPQDWEHQGIHLPQ